MKDTGTGEILNDSKALNSLYHDQMQRKELSHMLEMRIKDLNEGNIDDYLPEQKKITKDYWLDKDIIQVNSLVSHVRKLVTEQKELSSTPNSTITQTTPSRANKDIPTQNVVTPHSPPQSKNPRPNQHRRKQKDLPALPCFLTTSVGQGFVVSILSDAKLIGFKRSLKHGQ